MGNQMNQTNVTTGRVRLSYLHLFAPYANNQGEEPKYKATVLIPKSDIATRQRIDAAINAAIQQGIAGKWNGVRPAQLKNPIWDGDGFRQNGEVFGPECKGHWVLTASSSQKQQIVDINMNTIMDQASMYSGIYARVNIDFFPYLNSGNTGIGCGLGPVQKLEDGEPLGGRVSAAVAFGDNFSGYNQLIQGSLSTQQFVTYPQQNMVYQQQPVYNSQAKPIQYDPITGIPINGGIMGLTNEVPF